MPETLEMPPPDENGANPHQAPYLPALREVVTDTASGRVGEFWADLDKKYWMRPVGGGREFTAEPRHVRPATPAEVLAAKMAAAQR